MAGRSKSKYFQEPLFEELKRDTCYVCHGRIKKGEESVYIGQHLWRHKKCKPGGRNWVKNMAGRDVKTPDLFSPNHS